MYELDSISDSNEIITLTTEEANALIINKKGSFVTKQEAIDKANAIFSANSTKSANEIESCKSYWIRFSRHKNTVFRSLEIETDSLPLYVINYKNGGGSIISGDIRLPEVLAFSEKGKMSLDLTGTGVDVFIENIPLYIEYKIKNSEMSHDSLLNSAKNKLGINASFVPLSRIEYETTPWSVMYNYEPLVKVKWGQGNPYNLKFPSVSNEEGDVLEHAYVGCNLVALAQILSYHRYPSTIENLSINWYQITAEKYAYNLDSGYLDRLQTMLFKMSKTLKANYKYTGTGISTENVNKYYKNIGYKTDGIKAYDKDPIINSIMTNCPVHTVGYKLDENNKLVGHAWVIDGAQGKTRTSKEFIYEYIGTNVKPSDPIVSSEWKLVSETQTKENDEYVNCNFGYEGLYDGMYHHEVFKLNNANNYTYNLSIITNIKH